MDQSIWGSLAVSMDHWGYNYVGTLFLSTYHSKKQPISVWVQVISRNRQEDLSTYIMMDDVFPYLHFWGWLIPTFRVFSSPEKWNHLTCGDIFLLTFSSAPSAPHSDMRCCLIMETKPSVLTPERNSLVTTATWKIAFARKLAKNVQYWGNNAWCKWHYLMCFGIPYFAAPLCQCFWAKKIKPFVLSIRPQEKFKCLAYHKLCLENAEMWKFPFSEK